MTERDEERLAGRVDQLVEGVLGNKHLKATPSDAGERDAIRAAASLAGSREGYPRMTPAFRRRLAKLVEGKDTSIWMSRRALLGAGLAGAAGLAGGIVAQRQLGLGLPAVRSAASGATPYPAGGREIVAPLPSVAKWWDTGVTLADLDESTPRRVSAGSVGAFVIRNGSQVHGISAYCTHFPCELDYVAERALLNCPCHNMPFNLEGESVAADVKLPSLPLVQVRVVGGRVEVLGTK
jgi:nitrite reductase/ring-hydroxylating ferredoxin subunit